MTSRKERRTDDLRAQWKNELEEVLREVEEVEPGIREYLARRLAQTGRPPSSRSEVRQRLMRSAAGSRAARALERVEKRQQPAEPPPQIQSVRPPPEGVEGE